MPPKSPNEKRGRKPRVLTSGERQLKREFSDQLEELLDKRDRTVEQVAKELRVCRAALYNYMDKNKKVLAGFHTLKRAHDRLGFKFQYMSFDVPSPIRRRKRPSDTEPTLPFLEALKQDDIRVVGKKNVGSETLELPVQIRFAG